MSENTMERLENIQELDRMLNVVANQNKEIIVSGKKELNDIIKHKGLTFNIEQNGKDVEVTKDVYEVITNKEGVIWHEIYDDQGNLLQEISDEEFQKGKILTELGNGTFSEKSLIAGIYANQDDKSLTELESEQNEEISKALGMKSEDIKTLDIIKVSDSSNKEEVSKMTEEARKKIAMLETIGFSIDTNELATSDQTIKEFLNIDADNLLVVKVNSEWKALKINDDGSIEIEDNLQIADNSQSFTTINPDSTKETRQPSVEFRRKDNPNYSLAIDSNSKDKTQAFLVVGESRTASEIEAEGLKSPYTDVINNELIQQAQENPEQEEVDIDEENLDNDDKSGNGEQDDDDIDIHEPDEPSLGLGPIHF